MSQTLGSIELPNGGLLGVSSYVGPGKERRLQLTLEQGEGGLVAYGNLGKDGVAKLVGILETWLLEGKAARTLDDVRLATVDGPSPRAVAMHAATEPDGAEKYVECHYCSGTGIQERFAPDTPASDRLEASDTATELEDFGKVGEERDAAYTAALERRRLGVSTTAGAVWDAVRAAAGRAGELSAYCQTHPVETYGVLELETLTQHAARYLLAVQTLESLLRVAGEHSG